MNMLLIAVAVVAALIVMTGLWLVATANRLDRLHVRMDAGWAALDNALARRAVAARAIATTVLPADYALLLRTATERAEQARRGEREAAENELTSMLAGIDRAVLPPPLAVDLADAEHRIVIARRVHSDAVRDALTLRRRRRVRYFRLAGTAALPEYFEIAEPDPALNENGTSAGRPGGGHAIAAPWGTGS